MPITIKSKKNILDFVPVKNEKFEWLTTENGLVQIIIQRNGILDRIIRIFKKTPLTFRTDLDEYGTFVWLHIDGKRDIYEIGKLMSTNFDEDTEQTYIRIGQFMNLLKNNNFIYFQTKK